jgi:small subunit ribosomal protein S14
MAKTCTVNRNEERKRMVANHAEKRAKLKAIIIDESLPFDARMEARDALNALPRDGSAIRIRLRCALTGRSRGNYRKFQLCRNKFREMASRGELPGVTKSSW